MQSGMLHNFKVTLLIRDLVSVVGFLNSCTKVQIWETSFKTLPVFFVLNVNKSLL